MFRSTPQLGPGIEGVINDGGVWFDVPGLGTLISPKVLNPEETDLGQKALLVVAGGAIAADTQIAISATGVATTGGSTGYFTQVGAPVVEDDFFWAVRKDFV